MQTVTSPVLSPSSHISTKSAKTPESRGHVFADNLQKAKRDLDSSAQQRPSAGTSGDKSSNRVDAKENDASASPQKNTNADTTASTKDDASVAPKETDKTNSDHSKNINDASSKEKIVKSDKASTQEKSTDGGNKLQREGQNSPDGKAVDADQSEMAKAIKGEKLKSSDTMQKNPSVMSQVSSENASQDKKANVSATANTGETATDQSSTELVSSSSKGVQANSQSVTSKAQTVAINKKGQPVIATDKTAGDHPVMKPSVSAVQLDKVSGEPIKKGSIKEGSMSVAASVNVGEHSKAIKTSVKGATDGDASQLVSNEPLVNQDGSKVTSTLSATGDAKLNNAQASQTAPSAAQHSPTDSVDSLAADGRHVVQNTGVLAEKGSHAVQNTDALAVNGKMVKGGVQSDAAGKVKADLTNNKIPPEVRALHETDSNTDKASIALAAIGLGAKALNRDASKKVAGDNVLAATKKEGKKDKLDATGASEGGDNTELSWVLSQMGNAAPTKSPSGQTIVSKGTEAISPAGSAKVADQVALANAMKSAQQPATGPLILGDSSSIGQAGVVGAAGGLALALDGNGDNSSSNAPIELRKKEQDALIGKMSTQLDGSTKDADTGGLNSSLPSANNATNRLAPALSTNMQSPNVQQNLAMSVPPNHPGWAGEMSQKIAWVAQSGGHSAHIKLDPPELGSLTVKVSVDSDNNNTQVSFMAATPQARDLLENQMGRLRDMLAQQGMDLSNVDVGVSQQDTSSSQYQSAEQDSSNSNLGSFLTKDDGEDGLVPQNISHVSPSGIDYYA